MEIPRFARDDGVRYAQDDEFKNSQHKAQLVFKFVRLFFNKILNQNEVHIAKCHWYLGYDSLRLSQNRD